MTTTLEIVREALNRHLHVTPGLCTELVAHTEALELENARVRAEVGRFFGRIAHGDEAHREWLQRECDALAERCATRVKP